MAKEDFLYSETGVNIDRLNIITGTGNKLDYTMQLLELNLFEDIMNSVMSGNLLLQDTFNLIEKNPLCGQEWLFVRVSKPGVVDTDGNELKISKLFRIYKIEKVTPQNERVQNYLVHFMTEDMIVSRQYKWCKGYKLVKPETVILDIFQNGFEYDPESIKQYFEEKDRPLQESFRTYNLTVPNMHYFDAINFMSAKAVSFTGLADYIFYENGAGYRFDSLSTLFQNEPTMTINYKVKNVTGSQADSIDPQLNTFVPISLSVETLFDILQGYITGEYGIQADTLDFSLQRYISKPLDYMTFLKDYKTESGRLNQYAKIPKTDWKELTEPGEEIYFRTIMRFAPTTFEKTTSDTDAESMATRLMQFSSLLNQRIKLHMPGNAVLRAGRILDLKYPSIQSKASPEPSNSSGGQQESTTTLLDKYLAARYLITSVRHRITLKTWDSYLEITKDTLPSELPEHFAQNYTLEGL